MIDSSFLHSALLTSQLRPALPQQQTSPALVCKSSFRGELLFFFFKSHQDVVSFKILESPQAPKLNTSVIMSWHVCSYLALI